MLSPSCTRLREICMPLLLHIIHKHHSPLRLLPNLVYNHPSAHSWPLETINYLKLTLAEPHYLVPKSYFYHFHAVFTHLLKILNYLCFIFNLSSGIFSYPTGMLNSTAISPKLVYALIVINCTLLSG